MSRRNVIFLGLILFWFGAKGDEKTDDRLTLSAAFNSSLPVIRLDPGRIYLVSDRITVSAVTGKKIIATGASVLCTDLTKPFLLFQACTNLEIEGGLWGYRTMPSTNTGGSQHVMQFDQCVNVMVNNAHISQSGEMGIATTSSLHVTIQNSTIEKCFRDGTYAHYSADVRYLNNRYSNIKDDAMSFHDYGRASERKFIAGYGYNQASGLIAANNVVENVYQGFSSVAGAQLVITNNRICNTVAGGIALQNQQNLWPDGTAKLTDAVVDGNRLIGCAGGATINGVAFANGGQGSSGRASITCVSLDHNNVLTQSPSKRQSNVRIRNNCITNSGALGIGCYTTDGLILSSNTIVNATVTGNTLGGSAIEVWECTQYQEAANVIIDTRSPVQHQYGISYSGVSGTYSAIKVINRTLGDRHIGNCSSLVMKEAGHGLDSK